MNSPAHGYSFHALQHEAAASSTRGKNVPTTVPISLCQFRERAGVVCVNRILLIKIKYYPCRRQPFNYYGKQKQKQKTFELVGVRNGTELWKLKACCRRQFAFYVQFPFLVLSFNREKELKKLYELREETENSAPSFSFPFFFWTRIKQEQKCENVKVAESKISLPVFVLSAHSKRIHFPLFYHLKWAVVWFEGWVSSAHAIKIIIIQLCRVKKNCVWNQLNLLRRSIALLSGKNREQNENCVRFSQTDQLTIRLSAGQHGK